MKTSEEDDIWARGYYWEVPFLPVRVVIDKCDIFQSLPTPVVMGSTEENISTCVTWDLRGMGS